MYTYSIKATKDLSDATDVKCFSKDKVYTFTWGSILKEKSSLMNVTIPNDLGIKHRIGTWYKHFNFTMPAN